MVTLLDVVPPKDFNSFVDLYLVRVWLFCCCCRVCFCGCGDDVGSMGALAQEMWCLGGYLDIIHACVICAHLPPPISCPKTPHHDHRPHTQVFEYVDTDLYKLILSPQQLTNDHIETFVYQVRASEQQKKKEKEGKRGLWLLPLLVCVCVCRCRCSSLHTDQPLPPPTHLTTKQNSCCCRSSTCSRRT
jgi:hypothetical protein